MNRFAVCLALAVAACADSGGSVSPDTLSQEENAAVHRALSAALATDTLYPTLAIVVFPFVDRATIIKNPSGDTTRMVGVQLDIDVADSVSPDTVDTLVIQFSGLLAWRGYNATLHTVDTTVFILGAGFTPPFSDSLRPTLALDTAGHGTAYVVHEAADSQFTTFLSQAGAFHVTGASYGGPQTATEGTLKLAVSRGTMRGDYHVTATDSTADTVITAGDAAGGIEAIKIRITGTTSGFAATRLARAPRRAATP
ncbi:MAG TPA: hypothetical protein VFK78_06865 [Gemmatimonadales bacterium]|nr:hypothetical protein [Gemmatimonadales bacterium]